jgi:ABC-type multidrug transport system fused ATPase/permease subunit
VVTQRQGKRIHEASRKQRRREGAMASTAAESLAAIKLVQSLSLERAFARTFANANAKSLKDGVKIKRLSAGARAHRRRADRGRDGPGAVVRHALVLSQALTPATCSCSSPTSRAR